MTEGARLTGGAKIMWKEVVSGIWKVRR